MSTCVYKDRATSISIVTPSPSALLSLLITLLVSFDPNTANPPDPLAYLTHTYSTFITPQLTTMYSRTILSGLFATLLSMHASAVDTTRDPGLDANLNTAATQLDRLALLPNDSQWTFDFTEQSTYTFSPGSVVNANAATFPASVDNGLTLAIINLGPCSMLAPHYHPRGSNYVVAVSGNTTTYMIEENGARTVTSVLTPGKMTIFPQASVHTMVNTGKQKGAPLSLA